MVDNWNLIRWQPPTASVMPAKEKDYGSPFPNWLPSPGMQLPPDLALCANLYGYTIFLRTAITSYNKLDGLIEHKFTLVYFWNPKVQYQFHRAKIQVSLKLYLGGCPGEPVLASSSRCYFGGTSILAASAPPSLLCFSSLFWPTFIRTCDGYEAHLDTAGWSVRTCKCLL